MLKGNTDWIVDRSRLPSCANDSLDELVVSQDAEVLVERSD
jgi:hypothetical protein